MAEQSWLNENRTQSCGRCYKQNKAVEMVQLHKDFDSAKVCTKCAGELSKKIEKHRSDWASKGRKEEIRIFKNFMDKRSIWQDDSGVIGCLAFFIMIVLVIVLIIKFS